MTVLSDKMGHKAANRLTAMAGGRILRIPPFSENARARQSRARLVSLVGVMMAEDLMTLFGGTRIYIPRGPSIHNGPGKGISLRAIAALTKSGMTAPAIAQRLGCSERIIYKKRAQATAQRKERIR